MINGSPLNINLSFLIMKCIVIDIGDSGTGITWHDIKIKFCDISHPSCRGPLSFLVARQSTGLSLSTWWHLICNILGLWEIVFLKAALNKNIKYNMTLLF